MRRSCVPSIPYTTANLPFNFVLFFSYPFIGAIYFGVSDLVSSSVFHGVDTPEAIQFLFYSPFSKQNMRQTELGQDWPYHSKP